MSEQVDFLRLMRVASDIYVEGICTSDARQNVIADAIFAIQTDGKNALTKGFLGVKNYASFGDQRSDCEYGYKPTHGDIVFSVGRSDRDKPITLGEDHIYFLEAARDFPGHVFEEKGYQNRWGLSKVLSTLAMHKKKAAELESLLCFSVDSHSGSEGVAG